MAPGCRGKPATNKHRMNPELSHFAARLRFTMARQARDNEFNALALELFALQFKHNPAYQTLCEARGRTPQTVEHWTQIPAVPAAAFKELELTSLAPAERTAVFHSSGTTEQKPSRHFHSAESLALYEASLIAWFLENVPPDLRFAIDDLRLICLTPPPTLVPHSSLVHMFDVVRREYALPASVFIGQLAKDGSWTLDFVAAYNQLKAVINSRQPVMMLGTAFSFVHLLDYLASKDLVFNLPAGSLVMETGGYKNRSRTMPKAELHALITEQLGVPPENILCEYGMSELSSQAYDGQARNAKCEARSFHFPPWVRVQIVSPETGLEVGEGEWGLIRVFDLANVFSVAAIQTEDLAVRRGDGFELIGRATQAEPRGCSLMTA
jgi:acyl-protein synthetase LuxE